MGPTSPTPAKRPPRQRGPARQARGSGQDHVPVWVVRDRSGATADSKRSAASTAESQPRLGATLAPDTRLCTEGARVYRAVTRKLGITHRPLNRSAGLRVLAGAYPLHNVNAYPIFVIATQNISFFQWVIIFRWWVWALHL